MTVFIATAAVIISIVLCFCIAYQQREIEELDHRTRSAGVAISEMLDSRKKDKAVIDTLKGNYESTHRLALQAYNDVVTIINTPIEGKHAGEDETNA